MKTMRAIVFVAITVLVLLNASTAVAENSGRTLGTSYQQITKPAGIDLDVTYISRTPLYNSYEVLYTADGRPYLQPGTENDKRWPAPGETVTFTAHIRNKGTMASGAFAYRWRIDGVETKTGTHASLAPGQEATESFQWAWPHQLSGECLLGSHTVEFAADPAGLIAETYESNNSLVDRTDALSLVMALSPAAYAALEVPADPQWPFSAEDWLQKQIAAMNAAFERSQGWYAPDGILERVRIDRILVSNSEPPRDPNEDGVWFIAGDVRLSGGYYYPPTDVDNGLIHELTHQLGIIDMYNLDVSLEIPQVLDQLGQPVQMEYSSATAFPGLMNDTGIQPPIYDEHTTRALNANKGCRRGYFGEYLYDIPDQVYLKVYDPVEQPAPGVTVKLYQRSSDPGQYGSWFGTVDNTPEFTGVTDANGLVLLDNRPTPVISTNTGHTLKDNPFGMIDVTGRNDQFILELSRDGHQEFTWLDITAFNLARWRGGQTAAAINVFSHVPRANGPAAPIDLRGFQEFGLVKLQWSASPSAGVTYNIYRTNNSGDPYERIATNWNSLSYSLSYEASQRAATYVVTAVDSQRRESGFSNPFYAFRLSRPLGVVVDDQNGRIVLDPQNGYGLYYQLENGTFFDTRGSVDYHLERSEYIGRDTAGHLLISHPGDDYSARHSVRVAGAEANPLFEFGSQGSGPGQFETPAGVAAWGAACGVQGPYTVDASTLLLLHFNNSIDGEQGEFGTMSGVTFAGGKYGQAVTVDSTDTLVYPSSGNINRTKGSIEFWVRPHWNGGDGQSYIFFEVGNNWFNRMRIMKDGANNLRFMVWDSDTEYGVAYNVADWQAGKWHHVAASWSGTNLSLYVDGEKRASTDSANPPDVLDSSLYIGSTFSSGSDPRAYADIDEFRISSIPRLGNSDTCNARILVADSGNNRIQAFDRDGNVISSFGSQGSVPGTFHNPQGLAVDANGNVIVVDSGNNRLQVLSFDGSSFGFLGSIEANFMSPTGVATYGTNRIVVADTGNSKVKVLNGDGMLLGEYTAPNDGHTGAFNHPRGVAVDHNGAIVVADTGNQRVVSILGTLEVEVDSIARLDANPTNSSSVRFRVKFSDAVTGVDKADFALTTTGVTNAAITEVTGSGDIYTVTVNTGIGSGTIRLDLLDDNTIRDAASRPLGGSQVGDGNFNTGETYTIDKTLPPFTTCAAQTQTPQTECDALVALYNSTNGAGWKQNTYWLLTSTPCSWYGVLCDSENHVTDLNLGFNQLTGPIPSQLSNLTHLKVLALGINHLTGTIPSQLGSLPQLTYLRMDGNQLTGSIPSNLGNLTNLTYLNLENNPLSGSLPPQLGNLSNLTTLWISATGLSGPIPVELADLTKLQYLNLEDNQLTGSIPPELGNLVDLKDLRLSHNQLTGPIPPKLGNLANLWVLSLLDNQLTGPIPAELGGMSNLDSLYLDSNQLTGPIPPQLGNLSKLIMLSLGNNQLSGPIPATLGNLVELRTLTLRDNQLVGVIPNELGHLILLDSLNLQGNHLVGEFPSSIVNLTNLVSFHFDCWLTSTNPAVIAFLEGHIPGWQKKVCPVVASIRRAESNPTSATSVKFTVTFSEPVSGVSAAAPFDDLALTATGVTGAAIARVSGSGAAYTVTVNTGTGDGSLRLDLVDDNTILDVDANSLGGAEAGDGSFASGESYTISRNSLFSDVPTNHPYYQDIMILYANGLTAGCSTSPLKFCPDQIMNRGQAAVFMLRGSFGSSFIPDPAQHIFQDNWTKGPWAEPWAESMRNNGLSAGCQANPPKYCPWAQIPREQAVIFALRMKYGTDYLPPPATGTLFADMKDSNYYATAWAEQAYQEGLLPGCGMSGGKPKICPKELVSRGLAAYMIVRAKGLSMP